MESSTDNHFDNEEPKNKDSLLKGVLGGKLPFDFLYKNYRLVIMIFIMLLILIENGYEVERMHKEINLLKKQVRELRIESIQRASELMYIRKQSEVEKQVLKYGLKLKSSKVPPFKLYK